MTGSTKDGPGSSKPRRFPGSAAGARRAIVSGRGAVLISVFVIAVILLALPLREYLHQRTEIATAEEQASTQQQKVDDLQHQADSWQDPNFVMAEARKRLHFLLPGEVGYQVLLPGQENGPPIEPPRKPTGELIGPWYGKLWASLRAADRDSGHGQLGSFPNTPALTNDQP